MRTFGVRTTIGAGLLAASVLSAAGCQNKLYDENKKLREENRELRAQNEVGLRPAPGPELTPPPTPAPAPVAPPPTQPMVVTPPPPPPAPAPSPAPEPSLQGTGLEVTENKAAGTTTVNLPGDIFFDSGKATIKETAKSSLDKVATALKKDYGGKSVRVQGHTDSDPIKHSTWASNEALSKARADKVKEYLVSKGVAGGSITTEGLGATQPKDPKDKAKNRRVEIVVVTR